MHKEINVLDRACCCVILPREREKRNRGDERRNLRIMGQESSTVERGRGITVPKSNGDKNGVRS